MNLLSGLAERVTDRQTHVHVLSCSYSALFKEGNHTQSAHQN